MLQRINIKSDRTQKPLENLVGKDALVEMHKVKDVESKLAFYNWQYENLHSRPFELEESRDGEFYLISAFYIPSNGEYKTVCAEIYEAPYNSHAMCYDGEEYEYAWHPSLVIYD